MKRSTMKDELRTLKVSIKVSWVTALKASLLLTSIYFYQSLTVRSTILLTYLFTGVLLSTLQLIPHHFLYKHMKLDLAFWREWQDETSSQTYMA